LEEWVANNAKDFREKWNKSVCRSCIKSCTHLVVDKCSAYVEDQCR
jgi:hypothetical protein